MTNFNDKKNDIESDINSEWDKSIVPTMSEYIKIPNQSPDFDPEWKTNGLIDKAMDLLVDWVKKQPLQRVRSMEVHKDGERTPFLLIEIDSCSDSQDTILMYGHMDKQPPMDNPPWAEGLGPYIPVIRDDKLYGRGGADDGYAVCCAVTAIVALQKSGVPHGRIIITIEGCEESGSFDLDHYMEKCRTQIGDVGLVICLDSGAFTYDRMWITGSLRGCIGGILTVNTISESIHSGVGGGVCPCPFRVARILLDRVENSETGEIKLDGFKVPVPEDALSGFNRLNEIGSDIFVNQYPIPSNLSPEVISKDQTSLMVRNNWVSCMTVTGFSGLPQPSNAGNVIQPACQLKISVRLAPGLEWEKASSSLENALLSNPPYGAKVTFEPEVGGGGWCAKPLEPWLQTALDDGSKLFYGNNSGYTAIGGSIPFMKMLGDWYPEAQFVITGVLGPKSNAHGPNEFLHIGFAKKLTCAVSKIISEKFLNPRRK